MITPEQIRAGRALINAKQSDLAKRAGMSLATLNNIERGTARPRVKTWAILEDSLVQEGIEILADSYGYGVRLKTHERAKYSNSRGVLENVVASLKLKAINPIKRAVLCFNNTSVPYFFLWLDYGIRSVVYDHASFTFSRISKSQEFAGLILAFKSTDVSLEIMDNTPEIRNLCCMDAIILLRKQETKPFEHTHDVLSPFENASSFIEQASSQPGHLLTHLVKRFGGL